MSKSWFFIVSFFFTSSVFAAAIDCTRIQDPSYVQQLLRDKVVSHSNLSQEKIRCTIKLAGDKDLPGEDVSPRTNHCNAVEALRGQTKIRLYSCKYYGPGDDLKKIPEGFFLDEKGETAIDGIVDRLEDGRYIYYPPPQSDELPPSYSCNGTNGNEMQCLVCNCFFEARGQSLEEQLMVNRVVHSRVLSPAHPSSICEVVHDPDQFSWTRDDAKTMIIDKFDRNFQLGEGAESQLKKRDLNSYRKCVMSTKESLKYKNQFFASHYVEKDTATPTWLTDCKRRTRDKELDIDMSHNRISRDSLAHNFYRICERSERRCLVYPTCKAPAPSSAPASEGVLRPRMRPESLK